MSSLTGRMSLLFMLAVMVVLSLAAVAFNRLSEHHFRVLDRQLMAEKVEAIGAILADPAAPHERLQVLLAGHRDLHTQILREDGSLLFAAPAPFEVPARYLALPEGELWQWRSEDVTYRGLRARLPMAGQAQPVTAVLRLDVTDHLSFFR